MVFVVVVVDIIFVVVVVDDVLKRTLSMHHWLQIEKRRGHYWLYLSNRTDKGPDMSFWHPSETAYGHFLCT